MKELLFLLLTSLLTMPIAAQTDSNKALRLDGKDNNVRTGIGFLEKTWTLETWLKGDDTEWKDLEVIFGGGEYSKTNRADYLPLVIKNGKLHNTWADLWSDDVLDDQWHHVALSCDGAVTSLYLDGKMIDCKAMATSVLPGALGINEDESTTFGGLIDEVRVWDTAVPAETLREWMGKPLQPSHPQFKSLVAYYNFDDEAKEVFINWAGKGDQAYHIRNGRCKYKETAPLAYTVESDNPRFAKPLKRQELFNAIEIDSKWDAEQGDRDNQILKLRIAVTGGLEPLRLTGLRLDLSGVTSLSDLTKIHVYHTGKTARSGVKTELFGTGQSPKRKMTFKDEQGGITLSPGINYFLVTADVADKARVGNKIQMSVASFTLGGKTFKPETANSHIFKHISRSTRNNPNLVKVLQWNIWHGGNHVGEDGPARIIDLVKATNADIITMQEGYGSQKRIQDSLGYYMQTPSLKDNLVLFSRYPIEPLPTKKTFFSNPVKVYLPGNRPLLVNACWLRYAYRPEYSCNYPIIGHDVSKWIAEDSILGLEDIKLILENDTKPVVAKDNMPVIIGGDFNSCSHLDWTKEAAPIHFGYGPVAFPISAYMLREGYTDSFREVNPDEVARHEGTYAVIFGQLQVSRIDFLYYKGSNIKAVNSKIIKTTPEIDDVWASDHAAVLSEFEVLPTAGN